MKLGSNHSCSTSITGIGLSAWHEDNEGIPMHTRDHLHHEDKLYIAEQKHHSKT